MTNRCYARIDFVEVNATRKDRRHGTKLENREWFIVKAETFLSEEYRKTLVDKKKKDYGKK